MGLLKGLGSLIFILILFIESSRGEGNSFYIGAGTFANNVGIMANAEDSTPSSIGAVYPTVGITFIPQIILLPEFFYLGIDLGYTPFSRELPGEALSNKFLFVSVAPQFRLQEIDFKAGVGLLSKSLKGAGGTVELDNGTSTATFSQPSENRSIKQFYWIVGIGVGGSTSFRLDLDTYITTPLSGQKRAYSVGMRLSYGLF